MQTISLQEARDQGLRHYFTGLPCSKNHVSLRLVSGRNCVECSKVHCQIWSKNNKPHLKNYNSSYMSTEHGQRTRKDYAKYYATTPNGKAAHVRGASKRRALKLNSTIQNYSYQEKIERFDMFNNKCGYCGKQDQLSEDHFIPLTKGGKHFLTNIVPACKSCNSSKHNSMPEDWYSRQTFYSKDRWRLLTELCNG